MTPSALAAFRLRFALSQRELGRLLGLPANTIWRWEQGKMAIQQPALLGWALTGLGAALEARAALGQSATIERGEPQK